MDAHGGRTRVARRTQPASVKASQAKLRRVVSSAFEDDATYKGLPAGVEATEQMLSRLVTRMRWGGFPWPVTGPDAWTSDDNTAIPAGYTYLAQLVAHDMVENTAQLPLISEFPGELQRDYRTQRLVLDTIYGGGPARDPLPYGVATNGTAERCLFRLGHVRGQEPQPFDPNPMTPLLDQPARDVPRARCPHLSDRPASKASPDTLLADPRNDQHLLISQLTTIFLEFHNVTFKKIRALQDLPRPDLVEALNFPKREEYTSDVAFLQSQHDMAFLQTRKLVAYVYRLIVVKDLLKKLLEPGVYARYTNAGVNWPKIAFDPIENNLVPVEFSHAVFRFGHVMTRFSYILNDKLDLNPSIKNILDRAGAKRSDLLPVASNWLVDWSHFFDLGDGKQINAARRISPFVAFGPLAADGAVPEEKDRDGGLFYRDFVRGYEASVSTIAALIDKLPPSERDRSDLLKDSNLREHEVGRWLTHVPNIGFKPEELVSLSEDPPLLFFIEFEAAYTQGGRRLGVLGSTLIADVFFNALKVNQGVIEDDPAVQLLSNNVFAGTAPASMPSLIRFIKFAGGLADVNFSPTI
jgi:Animal haem peroxidase